MAGSNYHYDKNKSFFSEEVDDEAFLRSGRRSGHENYSVQDRHQQLLEERRKIEERTIQSSYRSIGLLHESEQIGAATAEELNHQREQLQNTEGKLDEINSTLRVSQRHIQGIKSVFGSLRNYFSGKNDASKLATSSSSAGNLESKEGGDGSSSEAIPESRSKLTQILEKSEVDSKSSIHPTERFRSEEPLASRDVDSILDKNLDDIGISISRLKNLGLDLNKEIIDQNVLLDRITNKTEDVEYKVQSQTKDMTRILKK